MNDSNVPTSNRGSESRDLFMDLSNTSAFRRNLFSPVTTNSIRHFRLPCDHPATSVFQSTITTRGILHLPLCATSDPSNLAHAFFSSRLPMLHLRSRARYAKQRLFQPSVGPCAAVTILEAGLADKGRRALPCCRS
jgi:hypothetical protein